MGDVSRRVRILIVDDDRDLRLVYRTAPAIEVFDVHEVPDGLTALKFIDHDPPDALILDLGLPPIHGTVVLRSGKASSMNVKPLQD
jgi:DNA-binding response OmpR family regulator